MKEGDLQQEREKGTELCSADCQRSYTFVPASISFRLPLILPCVVCVVVLLLFSSPHLVQGSGPSCVRIRARVDVFSCVCVRDRKRERVCIYVCVCVCVCVCV